MYKRVKNRTKREINYYFSRLFKHTISISTAKGDKVEYLSNGGYFSYEKKCYSYNGEQPYWMNFKDIKLRDLFLKELKNVEVIDQGAIINSEGCVELESTIFQEEYLFELNSNHLIFFRKLLPFERVERAIVLTNFLHINYYHWLLEGFSRLTLIAPDKLNNYKIIIDSNAPKFMTDSLIDFMDIKPENIYLKKKKRLKISTVLIPSFPHTRDPSTSWTNIYNPNIIQRINSLSKNKTLLTTEKRNIIISRKKTSQRRILNAEVILQKYGYLEFEIVVLEDLPFIELMQLFRNVGIVIATHGAGLANLLFSEHTSVIEFFPSNRNNRDGFYFYQISSALNLFHSVIEYDAKNAKQDLFIDDNILTILDKIITEHKV